MASWKCLVTLSLFWRSSKLTLYYQSVLWCNLRGLEKLFFITLLSLRFHSLILGTLDLLISINTIFQRSSFLICLGLPMTHRALRLILLPDFFSDKIPKLHTNLLSTLLIYLLHLLFLASHPLHLLLLMLFAACCLNLLTLVVIWILFPIPLLFWNGVVMFCSQLSQISLLLLVFLLISSKATLFIDPRLETANLHKQDSSIHCPESQKGLGESKKNNA